MYPPMYQHPMYFPYNAGLVPTMYYPHTLGRGFIPNRQMLGRFIPPPGGFSFARGTGPVREGIQRTVEMPGGRNVRHAKGRHMYYSPPRVQSFAAVPGYPLLQPPQHPSGGYFYHLPEDPRTLAFSPAHSNIHPYLTPGAQFSAHSLRQPAAFGTLPHHPGSGFHPLPQGSSPSFAGTRVFYQDPRLNRERSDTGESRMSDSPSSGIQLLPNVKHVPSHLRGKPGETSPEQPGSNSTTPPINAPIGTPMFRDERTAALSNRPYSPANYVRERSGSAEMARSYSPANFMREHAGDDIHSRRSYSPANYPRDERRSSADDVNSNHERSMSLSPPVAPSSMMPPDSVQQEQKVANTNGTSKLNSRRQKPNLILRTGFSRQYSDDLPTPTVITNMIQMIDENIDEGSTEEDSPSTTGERKHLRLKMSVAQRLQHMQAIEGSEASSSSTPPSVEDSHPSYASMVTRASPRHITAEEAAQLEIQTPRTPKGFITPGAEVEVDPFGILKSLNIGGAPHLKD